MRLFPLPLAPFVVAALLVGCGDDDDTTPTSTATGTDGSISVEQWATHAERICTEGDRAQERAARQRFGEEPPSQAELEEFGTAVVVPNLRIQRDALAALPTPAAEADRIDAMLDALGEGAEAIAADPAVLVQGADSVPALREATELAEELGLTECGSG